MVATARALAPELGIGQNAAEKMGTAELLALLAKRRADPLGHTLLPFQDDSDTSKVSTCGTCGKFAVVDYEEEPMIWGGATTTQCSGRLVA